LTQRSSAEHVKQFGFFKRKTMEVISPDLWLPDNHIKIQLTIKSVTICSTG